MDLSLTKLPWYAQLLAFVLLGIGAGAAFYIYYEREAQTEMAAKKGKATADKLPEFRAQVGDLERRLEGLRAVLPEEKDASDLLRRMQTVAQQSNLTIKSFKPSPVVTKQLHAEWPITLELDGTYHNLAIFFDRVGKFTRIVNISDVHVRGKDKPTPNVTITASCVATTFVLLDKPAAPAANGKDKSAPAKKAA